jgi:hypothetical protein
MVPIPTDARLMRFLPAGAPPLMARAAVAVKARATTLDVM